MWKICERWRAEIKCETLYVIRDENSLDLFQLTVTVYLQLLRSCTNCLPSSFIKIIFFFLHYEYYCLFEKFFSFKRKDSIEIFNLVFSLRWNVFLVIIRLNWNIIILLIKWVVLDMCSRRWYNLVKVSWFKPCQFLISESYICGIIISRPYIYRRLIYLWKKKKKDHGTP